MRSVLFLIFLITLTAIDAPAASLQLMGIVPENDHININTNNDSFFIDHFSNTDSPLIVSYNDMDENETQFISYSKSLNEIKNSHLSTTHKTKLSIVAP